MSTDLGPLGYVKDLLMDILAVVGLALGGSQAAATAEILLLQQESLKTLTPVPLTPAEAAAAVVKGHIDQGAGAYNAALAGVDGNNFRIMVETTGNPPGPETLLEMMRRGLIDSGRVTKGMQEGYIKPEWIYDLVHLVDELLPVSELVAAVVQNQMSQGEGAGLAALLGFKPDQFDVMVRTAGNPPGPGQALDMARRGIISEGDLEQALRESRLKNKWIPAFMQLQERRIPMRTITTLLNHHAIDDGTATRYLAELGYSSTDAAALIASSKYTAAKANHDLSVTQIKQMYTDRILSRDQAVSAMAVAGYTESTANQILALSDVQADHRIQSQAITQIRGRYVGHKIEEGAASIALDGIGVPPDQRDHLLVIWGFEREAAQAHLTLAQLEQAAKKSVISTDEFMGRVAALGYSPDDATIIAMTQGIIPNPNQGA